MAKYHLKEDGTAGVCTAVPGNCPKGDAIHGDSIQDVYSQLETVMQAQLLPDAVERTKKPYPAPAPRKSAEQVGTAGLMLQYTDPVIVKEQLDALQKLGLASDAAAVMERYQPVLAAAVRSDKLDSINEAALYEDPLPTTYGHRDTPYGEEWYTGTTKTWVAKAHYELQTLALNSFMDRLETGTLEDANLTAYSTALGNTSVAQSSYLAFNYNPHRQGKDFFNNVKNRFLTEGFREERVSPSRTAVRMPDFVWKGLDEEGKARVANHLLMSKYAGWTPHNGVVANVLNSSGGLGARDFGSLMDSTLFNHPTLHGPVRPAGQDIVFDLGQDDPSYPVVKVQYHVTDDGVEFEERQRLFYSKADRARGLHKQ